MASKLLRLPKNFASYPRRFKASSFHDEYKVALSQTPATEVTSTKNNVKVASQHLDRSTTTVGVFFDSGARNEEPHKNGVGNLVQRLVYKGSAKRSQADLEAEVAKMGASLKAFTSRERTGFYATCLNEDVPKIVELLADVVQNPRFDAADLEKERAKVIHSMGQIEENLKDIVLDNLHATAFQETPLAQNTLGELDVVESIKAEDLHYFVKRYFKASRTVVAASGGINHNQLAELTDKHFTKLDDTFDGCPVEWTPCRFTGSEIRWRDDSIPYAHFAIALKAPEAGSSETNHLLIAANALGSYCRTQGKNPEYFGTSYDDCHSFETFVNQYQGNGLFGGYAICETMQCEPMAENFMRRLRSMCHTISDAEVKVAKNRLLNNYLRQIDDNEGNCLDISNAVLTSGYRVPLNEFDAQLSKISAEQVRDFLDRWATDKCFALSAIGPIEGLTDYLNLRMRMYWYRI